MRSEKTKLTALRNFIKTVVKNSKNGVVTPKEKTMATEVATDLLGRIPTSEELQSLEV